MDIFDEQVPFTKEQFEYIRNKFVARDGAFAGMTGNGRIIFLNNFANQNNELTENRAITFLQRLATEGGAIVCSEACEDWELAAARSENRFFVDENNYGYVLRLERWRSLAEKSLGIVSRIESTSSDVCIENLVSEVKQIYANEN